jgi:hypothetical protein
MQTKIFKDFKMRQEYKHALQIYFKILDKYFGYIAKEAILNKVSGGTIARDFLGMPLRRDHFRSLMQEVIAVINSFWEDYDAIILKSAMSLPGTKARMGGDIGPQYQEHLLERVGVYFETVIVPDPMLRIIRMSPEFEQNRDYYLIKYAINQIAMKQAYLADIEPPIIHLVADRELIPNQPDFTRLGKMAEIDATIVINKIFGSSFQTFHDATEYFTMFTDVKDAVRNAKYPELLYWDEDYPRTPEAQAEALLDPSKMGIGHYAGLEMFPKAKILPYRIFSRMMQANDVLFRSREQGAHPLITPEVSFHWLETKLDSSREILESNLEIGQTDLRQTNALLGDNLYWLSATSIEDLIKIRSAGYLSDTRELINQCFTNLNYMEVNNIVKLSSEIDYNLNECFRKHKIEIKSTKSNFKADVAVTISGVLATAVVALKPSFLSFIPDWILPVVGAATLNEMVKTAVLHIRTLKQLNNSPVGILWKIKKKNQKNLY